MSGDLSEALQERVREASPKGSSLNIIGGNTKAFLGRTPSGEPLQVSGHSGILTYQPRELVLTARSGTPLGELEAMLAQEGQMLPFEPPHFGDAATLGGTLAAGLSGPRRPYVGAARDFVLGTRIINGRGHILRFGGEVMKNVAGYDLSRLMVGAMGTLGILLEVSLKVLPRPSEEITLVQECGPKDAVQAMNTWAGKPLPLSAACFDGERLYVRLSGAATAVGAARAAIGGDLLEDTASFWTWQVREQHHAFFDGPIPLWRLSVPPATPVSQLPEGCFIDWGGAQRWLKTDADPQVLRVAAAQTGGHATLFKGGDRTGLVNHLLPGPVMALHRNLKQAFDPQGLFNPRRLYPDL